MGIWFSVSGVSSLSSPNKWSYTHMVVQGGLGPTPGSMVLLPGFSHLPLGSSSHGLIADQLIEQVGAHNSNHILRMSP